MCYSGSCCRSNFLKLYTANQISTRQSEALQGKSPTQPIHFVKTLGWAPERVSVGAPAPTGATLGTKASLDRSYSSQPLSGCNVQSTHPCKDDSTWWVPDLPRSKNARDKWERNFPVIKFRGLKRSGIIRPVGLNALACRR